ncbi:hypothetical protein V8C40DRAFT_20809 [Trichoderma camerunense]
MVNLFVAQAVAPQTQRRGPHNLLYQLAPPFVSPKLPNRFHHQGHTTMEVPSKRQQVTRPKTHPALMTNRKINFSASLTHPFSGLLCFSPLPVALLLPLAPHRWFRLLIHFLEHATQSRAAASFFFFVFFFSFFFPPQNAMLKPGWFDGDQP